MRPSLDKVFLNMAKELSRRGTCAKKQVGCIVVDKDGHIISEGYNGQARGKDHCTKESKLTGEKPCPAYLDPSLSCEAIHAETNALIRCLDVTRAETMYLTEAPCLKCELLIQNTNIRYVIYPQDEIHVIWYVKESRRDLYGI